MKKHGKKWTCPFAFILLSRFAVFCFYFAFILLFDFHFFPIYFASGVFQFWSCVFWCSFFAFCSSWKIIRISYWGEHNFSNFSYVLCKLQVLFCIDLGYHVYSISNNTPFAHYESSSSWSTNFNMNSLTSCHVQTHFAAGMQPNLYCQSHHKKEKDLWRETHSMCIYIYAYYI